MTAKTFTLSSYVEAANKKYGSYTLELDEKTSTTLANPIRVPSDEARERLFQLVEEISSDKKADAPKEGEWNEVGADEDSEMSAEELTRMKPLLTEFFLLVGDDNTPKLLELIGNDLMILLDIFQDYFKEVGLGEASTSLES